MKKLLSLVFGILILGFSGCYTNKNSSTYRLGIDPSFIPLNTMGQETHLYGFCYEALQHVGTDLDQSIELAKFSWDDLLPNLKNGKLSGILTTLPPYNFYKKTYIFSEPLIQTGPVLVSKKGMNYSSLETLNGKILGIIQGTSAEAIAAGQSYATVQTFLNPSALLDALVRGQIDSALIDNLVAYAYCHDLYQEALVITSSPFGDNGIRFMANKEDPDASTLCDAINKLILSKDRLQLLEKWNLPIEQSAR